METKTRSGARCTNEKQKCTQTVILKLTELQRNKLYRFAETNDMTMSAVLRMLIKSL